MVTIKKSSEIAIDFSYYCFFTNVYILFLKGDYIFTFLDKRKRLTLGSQF